MNIRYPIYEGVYRILTFQPAATGAQTDKNKSLPVLSGRKGRKKLLHGTGGHDRRN